MNSRTSWEETVKVVQREVAELREELRVGNLITAQLTDRCRELEMQVKDARKEVVEWHIPYVNILPIKGVKE